MTVPSSPLSSSASESCRLCGAALQKRVEARAGFCCSGCERVHDVLSHLDESAHAAYLSTARRLGLIPEDTTSKETASPREVLPPDPEALRDERYACTGMVCPSCAWIVERVLLDTEGVEDIRVDFFSGTVKVRLDLRQGNMASLAEVLAPLGYGLERATALGDRTISKRATMQFVIVAVLTMNLMSLSFVRYAAELGYLGDMPEFLTWLELLLTLPVLYIGWIPMLRRAGTALRHGRSTMDLLVALAVGAAMILSTGALLTGRSDIFFETAAGLVAIYLLSQMIESRLRQKAFQDLIPLLKMPIVRVRQISDDGREKYVDVDQVEKGDRVLFLAGETVPVGGAVRCGHGYVSEAMLTGEPTPREKKEWDTLLAGSQVLEGRLELEVESRFEETRLSRIAASVSETLARAENNLRFADRITSWFVPTVLTVAVAIWLVRLLVYGLQYALSPAGWFPSVAVLAVACPCAFSLAGVSAITAATGTLLRLGILVKEPGQLTELSKVTRVVLDKTGTLTHGQMRVERLLWRDTGDENILSKVLAAEAGSVHPVARAIRAYLGKLDVREADFGDDIPIDFPGIGRGLKGSGSPLLVGSATLFDEVFQSSELTPRHSAVWFGHDRKAVGCFLLTDEIREEAPLTIQRLQRLGLACEIISGDRRAVTARVAEEIGIGQAISDAAIEDKVEHVRRLRGRNEVVAFVGDGTNDALAMAEANVSAALADSTDEALSASGFVVLGGRLESLCSLFAVGKRLHEVIRSNYLWAFVFNLLFVPVAALGYLVPLAAMLLMLTSSTAVLLNSLRARSFAERF